MKIHEKYTEYVKSVDGKEYRESSLFGFPFLSIHKEKCRKLVSKKTGTDYIMNEYELHTTEYKKDGVIKNRCKCGYEINPGVHFPEDEVALGNLKV